MNSYSEKALYALENQEIEEGRNLIEKAIEKDSDEVIEAAATQLISMGFLEEAKSVYLHLKSIYPKLATFNIPLAEIAIENNEIDEAFELLYEVNEEDESYPERLIVEADLYQVLNMPDISEKKLLLAKTYLPNEPILDFALAELYYTMGNYEASVFLYIKSREAFGPVVSGISIDDRMGSIYSKMGDFEKAIYHFEAALKMSETPDRLFHLGVTYLQVGETQKGIALLRKLYEENPDYYSVYMYLAEALMEEEELEEGLKIAEVGIRNNPYQVSLYHLASELAYRLHLKEKSAEILHHALQLEEEQETTLLALANLYVTEENYEAAIELIRNTDTEQPYILWLLAQSYYHNEEFDQATAIYLKIEKDLQEEPEFLKEYGMFLREEGEFEKSKRLLENYLKVIPDDIEVETLLNE